MAIVRLGHLVAGISGNLGSSNFANTRAGLVVRRRPTRANRASQKQLFRRSRYMLWKTSWMNLTSDDRAAWQTQAQQVTFTNRLGLPQHLSAFQYYMTAALTLRDDAQAMPTLPPYETRPPPLIDFTPAFTEGGPMLISTQNPATTTPILLRLYLSRPVSNHLPAHWRTWSYCGGLTTGFPSRDWEAKIEHYVGELKSGEYVGLRMHLERDGALLSPGLIKSTLVS